MKLNIKLIFFLIFLTIINYSCNKSDQYFYMNSSYKISFQEGQHLIFRSNTSKIDTFIVSEILTGLDKYTLTGTGGKAPFGYYEYEYIAICPKSIQPCTNNKILNASSIQSYLPNFQYCDSCFIIKKIMSERPIKAKDGYLEDPILKWKNKWEIKLSTYNSLIANQQIGNTNYSNIYVFSNSQINLSQIEVNKIYYNHKFGLLRFEYTNGETWELNEIH